MLCCVRKNSLLPVDGIGIVDHVCGFGFKALKVLTALCSNAREGWGSVMGNCSLTRGRILIGLAVSTFQYLHGVVCKYEPFCRQTWPA